MQIASIMIMRYILSLKVSKTIQLFYYLYVLWSSYSYDYVFSGWSANSQWKVSKFADRSLDRFS